MTTRSTIPRQTRLKLGDRAFDSNSGKTGVIQLFTTDLGLISTTDRWEPTHAILRPVDAAGAPWRAFLGDLEPPEGGVR